MIVFLRYSGNPRALQGHAKEEGHGGGGGETRGAEMEVEWKWATGRTSLLR